VEKVTGGAALYRRALDGVLPSLSNSTERPQTLKTLMNIDGNGTANRQGFYSYTEDEANHWQNLFREHAWTGGS
jgi:3-hydroxybutyryl-CoA dehydrogenase